MTHGRLVRDGWFWSRRWSLRFWFVGSVLDLLLAAGRVCESAAGGGAEAFRFGEGRSWCSACSNSVADGPGHLPVRARCSSEGMSSDEPARERRENAHFVHVL